MATTIKSLPGEIWKPVVGYHGFYEVSNMGRVRSVPRIVVGGGRCGAFSKNLRGRLLKLYIRKDGYVETCLSRNGEVINRSVHQLVLEAFVGPCPVGMQVCHFPDKNPANNCLDNLRWDTPKANQADRAKHGTIIKGEAHHATVLTEVEVRLIRSSYVVGDPVFGQAALARRFKTTIATVANIVQRRSWAWLS